MSSKKNVKIIQKFFKIDDWKYSFDEVENVFTGGLGTNSVLGSVDFIIRVTDEYVMCIMKMPIHATKQNMSSFSELINAINFKLIWGGFQLDSDDGELLFQYTMPSEELQDDPKEKAKRLLCLPHQMLRTYASAFMRIALGTDQAPKVLMKNAEKEAGYAVEDIEEPDLPSEPESEPAKDTDTQVQRTVEALDNVNPQEKPPQSEPENKDKEEDDDEEENVPVPVKNYTLEGMNIHGDFSLDKVLVAVKKFLDLQKNGNDNLPDRPRMNILLYGPPGTGKSEFVNYLGQQLGRKVVVKMASDILSHWVGKTERAIREAFKEAEKEHAILFLDELEGLMTERSEADANWQVTQVNEILNCMERFNGIMIGATNLKENLDAAVLRRFTYKIEFDYLEGAGKRIFFDRVFKTPLTEEEEQRLGKIANLTPGDFRTVSQQLYYLDITSNAERLAALEEECRQKKIRHRVALGFGLTN